MDAKKAMILVGVALVLFYVITQPTQAAEAQRHLRRTFFLKRN